MKLLSRSLFFLFAFSLLLSSCFKDPEFEDAPKILLESIEFKSVGTIQDPDSLIVTISFEDGDGDLGLGQNESDPQYNPVFYIDSVTREKLFEFSDRAIKYGFFDIENNVAVKTSTLDNFDFPSFTGINRCLFYEEREVNDNINNIIYREANPNQYNIFVDFYVKNGSGDFEFFDWVAINSPNCSDPFHGTFPPLKEDIDEESPLEGTLRYGMSSRGFQTFLGDKEIRLDIKIQDRKLNVSNTLQASSTLERLQNGEFDVIQ